MKSKINPFFVFFFTVYSNVALAELPVPIYLAIFYGDCATSVGNPSESPSEACASMIGRLAANCPSDTSGASYSPNGARQMYPFVYNCGVTISVPAKNDILAYTHAAEIGRTSPKFICKSETPTPKTAQEWYAAREYIVKNEPCPVPCPVEPLKPITNADAIRFENGDNVRTDRLSENTLRNLQCLRNALSLERPPGTLTVTSAWRPQAYQDHLREIVDKIKSHQ